MHVRRVAWLVVRVPLFSSEAVRVRWRDAGPNLRLVGHNGFAKFDTGRRSSSRWMESFGDPTHKRKQYRMGYVESMV